MAHLLCRFSFLFLSVAVMAKASRVHTVRVGFGGNFVFDPETTKADVGDLVVFEFFPSNHSVVRGEYAKSEACGDGGCQPCVPYELIHPGQQGFHSGNVLTQTVSTNRNGPTFNITIGDSHPVWFYCTALDSCHPNGMVGVINPASGQSIDTQKSAAINAEFQLSPGQPWPAEGSLPSQPSPATTPSTTKSSSTGSRHISRGAIAGIVISILLAIALTAALVFFIWRFKKRTTQDGSGEASAPLSGTKDDEEQTVLTAMRYEPTSPSVQDGLVSPITPPPRKKSLLQRTFFYKYPSPSFSEKPLVSPPGHPAFGLNSTQETTIELEGDRTFDRA